MSKKRCLRCFELNNKPQNLKTKLFNSYIMMIIFSIKNRNAYCVVKRMVYIMFALKKNIKEVLLSIEEMVSFKPESEGLQADRSVMLL
jgi:hypothetical protein